MKDLQEPVEGEVAVFALPLPQSKYLSGDDRQDVLSVWGEIYEVVLWSPQCGKMYLPDRSALAELYSAWMFPSVPLEDVARSLDVDYAEVTDLWEDLRDRVFGYEPYKVSYMDYDLVLRMAKERAKLYDFFSFADYSDEESPCDSIMRYAVGSYIYTANLVE